MLSVYYSPAPVSAECGVLAWVGSVLNSGRENNKGQCSDSPRFIANSEAAPSPPGSWATLPPLEHFNVSHWKIPTGEMSECPVCIVHFPLLIALPKCLLNCWRCVELNTQEVNEHLACHLTSQILMKPSGNFAILSFTEQMQFSLHFTSHLRNVLLESRSSCVWWNRTCPESLDWCSFSGPRE